MTEALAFSAPNLAKARIERSDPFPADEVVADDLPILELPAADFAFRSDFRNPDDFTFFPIVKDQRDRLLGHSSIFTVYPLEAFADLILI
jgi:hypothetical protein